MAIQKEKTSLQSALQGRFAEKGEAEIKSDIGGLYDTLSGYELVEAVIKRVQRYAIEASGRTIDHDFSQIESYTLDAFTTRIRDQLKQYVSSFISDTHREVIVRCHARGLSTSDAVGELINTDETIRRLAYKDAMGSKQLREILVHRLAYLKPSSTRWSEKKYGSVWSEAREEYKEALRDIPFTSQVEQVALLAKQAERINEWLETGKYPVKEAQMLSNSLVKTVLSLQKLTAVDEQLIPVNLSAPQLVGVLERLTLALKVPEQQVIGDEAGELVGVLERLTLALKIPQQRTNGNEAKALPAEAGAEGMGR